MASKIFNEALRSIDTQVHN